MRKCCLVVICIFMAGCTGLPTFKSIPDISVSAQAALKAQEVNKRIVDLRLPEFQKLTFEVRWLGIRVGTLTTAILGIKNYQGRDVYVLEATMQTNSFLSKIYRIEDRFVSYMDVQNLSTVRHEVYRRDGKYIKDAITEFDQVAHKASFKNLIDKTEKTFEIPEGVHDILTACYYFMLLPVNVGEKIEYFVCNNEKNYQFYGMIDSRSTIKIPAFDNKETEALLILPYAKLKGKKVDEGDVNAYFSNDKVKIPLMAIVKGPLFTEVSIALVKVDSK